MKRSGRRGCGIALLAAVLIVSATETVIYMFQPFAEQIRQVPGTVGENPNTGDLKIDADTIMASLDRRDADAFVPSPTGPEMFSSSLNRDPPPWHQAEYLRVAHATFGYIWGGMPGEWDLYRMTFETRCASVGRGFSWADFVFFRPVWNHGRLSYTGRGISIHPLDNVVTWGGGANYPHPLFGWKSIDPELLKVTADQALRIADLNGGEAARLRAENGCLIHLTLLPNAYRGWSVLYTGTANRRLFELTVNPYTGEITK